MNYILETIDTKDRLCMEMSCIRYPTYVLQAFVPHFWAPYATEADAVSRGYIEARCNGYRARKRYGTGRAWDTLEAAQDIVR